MVLSRLLNVAAGFLFWVIAAKLYSITEVGIATELISSLYLIMLFSRFGFDYSLVRYVANTDRNKAFNTSLAITTMASVAAGLVYIFIKSFFQVIFAQYGILFILIAAFNSITLITGNMFCALRKGEYFFLQTILASLRVFLLFPLVKLNSFGIFLALGTCFVISSIFSIWLLRKEIKIDILEIDRGLIKESCRFSIGTYFSNVLIEAPILILPIMVLHVIGQEEAAKYYMAMNIGNLALIVPYALSFSLFVEGSHGQPLKQNIVKAGAAAYLFLIPIVIVISLWGKNILALISEEYVEAYFLLLLVIAASFFVIIHMMFFSVQNIKMQVGRNVKYNLFRFLLLLGTSYFLIHKYNINGAGYAWLLTHVILTLVIAVMYIKDGLIKFLNQNQVKSSSGTLTTGPVGRHFFADNLVVVILNTTDLSAEVKVVVNDLTGGRKQKTENTLFIQGNFTETLALSKPPELYEVLIEGIPPGVYVWTSTSINVTWEFSQVSEYIDSNTFCHHDFMSIPKRTFQG